MFFGYIMLKSLISTAGEMYIYQSDFLGTIFISKMAEHVHGLLFDNLKKNLTDLITVFL